MNLKQLKPKLNFIKKNARPILTMVKVTKNSLEVNDLETYVTIKDNHGLSEGLHAYDTLGLVAVRERLILMNTPWLLYVLIKM